MVQSTTGKVNKAGRGYITVATSDPTRRLNVRSSPEVPGGGTDNVVTTLAHGTRRQVKDYIEGWVRIREGWVRARYVK
jgi:hypothetical protein